MFGVLSAAAILASFAASGSAQPRLNPNELRRAAALKVHRSPTRRLASEDEAIRSRLPSKDVQALHDAVKKAAGSSRDTIMVTITNGGMVDFAQNMLSSLDRVDDYVPRLVVGMGVDVCKHFQTFSSSKTSCVEVWEDMNTTAQVPWGTREYWRVVFRKHVVLTVIASSELSDSIIYTDPDIVFLDSPVAHFTNLTMMSDNHLTFSANNMLEPNATSVEDLALRYNVNGLANITLGPKNRRADINSGLFHMFTGPTVADFFLMAVKILKEEEFQHGHYQQFSLVKALGEVPGIKIGVASGQQFVNGNVFWGHRDVLDPGKVVSIHANWMQPHLKRGCLQAAGLWTLGPATADDHGVQSSAARGRRLSQRLTFQHATDRAVMDARSATILGCTPGHKV